MKIDRALNLVVPIEREEGGSVYVHAMPISLDTFEEYALVLARTFATIYKEGLDWTAGPRIAALILKKVATLQGGEENWTAIKAGLIGEIHRLTAVVIPGQGSAPIPYTEAIRKDLISQDDASEIENILVFFSLAWRMHKQSERLGVIRAAARLWGGSTSSLSATEYAASLQTSTETGSSGASPPRGSSVPS